MIKFKRQTGNEYIVNPTNRSLVYLVTAKIELEASVEGLLKDSLSHKLVILNFVFKKNAQNILRR